MSDRHLTAAIVQADDLTLSLQVLDLDRYPVDPGGATWDLATIEITPAALAQLVAAANAGRHIDQDALAQMLDGRFDHSWDCSTQEGSDDGCDCWKAALRALVDAANAGRAR